MAALPVTAKVEKEIAALAGESREAMIERWHAVYGRPPPKGISRRLLERSAAYQVQVKATGGLKPRLRRQLLSYATEDRRKRKTSPGGALSPGTRLVREWNGRNHTVEVVDQGFVWNGKVHRSLSAVAQAITGAGWSGPRFFGL
jgi:hypothetical protein